MPEVAIRTDDFRLAYRLLGRLRESGIEHVQIDPEHPVPNGVDYWIGSHAEVGQSEDNRGVGCALEEIDSLIVSIVYRLYAGGHVKSI